MSELGEFLLQWLCWTLAIFMFVGAIGGWLLLVALFAREHTLKRAAELAALDAASHPIVGHREAA